MGSKTRPRRSPRRVRFFGSELLPVHSAHVGQELEVHYRYHPYFGRKVLVRHIEQRATVQLVNMVAQRPKTLWRSCAAWPAAADEHIAASLNRMGLPTGQGKTWTAHRVASRPDRITSSTRRTAGAR
jgi:hypothetical protein